ncbi:MAG: homoserine O-acetyltransferase [Euryarchaeota archaeon RBG_13_57_23]|nr:MAG: homoserine O-acetyltransferase [Euryarchaeota archaeon RBG_13_57_23]
MREATVGIVKPKRLTFAAHPDQLVLESGLKLGPISLQYETYGELNDERSNAILVFHALSGDAHAAGYHKEGDEKPGWWDNAIGPGKAFDTDRYFVICSNIIGGCKGSTGPSSENPKTRKPYGLQFPMITVKDMVNAQAALLDHLEVGQLLATVGGSMGGFQALQFAVSYPNRCKLVIPIATAGRQSAQNIAFNEIGRQAIMADPHWNGGDYYAGEAPVDGLSIARMVGHVTYLSDETLMKRFGRKAKTGTCTNGGLSLQPYFEVESYLRHKGNSFTRRFDANSYLYITRAIDLFDLAPGCDSLSSAFRDCRSRFLALSFSSDWLYPPYQSEELVEGIQQSGLAVEYHRIESSYGHDAFLLEADKVEEVISRFLIHEGRKKYFEVDQGYPIS